MNRYLKVIPIPMSGMMLAFISLGNLLHSLEHHVLGHVAFFIGILLFISLVGKVLFAWQSVKQEMQNPIIASVSPTFTMGTMSLSSGLHIYHVNEWVIHSIWIVAAVLQVVIIVYFIKSFIWKKSITITNIFPSWLILFVGTAVMPLTAGDLSSFATKFVVIFAIVAFLILVPIIFTRGFIRKDLPEPTIPMLTILSAPASLSLAAYLKQFDGQVWIAISLFIIALVLFITVLSKLPSMLRLPFYPSYAAFTFPLVITATATNSFIKLLADHGKSYEWLDMLAMFQLVFSTIIVCYVLVRYMNYLVFQVKALKMKEKTSEQTI